MEIKIITNRIEYILNKGKVFMTIILLIFAFIFSVSSIFSKGSTSFGEDYDNDYVLVKGAVFDGEDETLPFLSGLKITIHDIIVGKYSVTQRLYKQVMKKAGHSDVSPSYFSKKPKIKGEVSDLRPVENVSWYDAALFCDELSKMQGLECVYEFSDDGKFRRADTKKNGWRLLSDNEWEYVYRAGNKSQRDFDFDSTETAWLLEECTHQVGLKKPNELGIYDLHGNVFEWTSTISPKKILRKSEAKGTSYAFVYDPPQKYVARGGCWNSSFERETLKPSEKSNRVGFRICRNATLDAPQ